MKAFGHEEGIAILIGFLPFVEIVGFAVEFDDQLDRQASKVSDVIPERDLAPKTKPVNSIGLQVTPKQGFGTSHRLAKSLRTITLALADGCVRHWQLPPSLTLPHKGGGNGETCFRSTKEFQKTHELNPPASVGMSSGLKP